MQTFIVRLPSGLEVEILPPSLSNLIELEEWLREQNLTGNLEASADELLRVITDPPINNAVLDGLSPEDLEALIYESARILGYIERMESLEGDLSLKSKFYQSFRDDTNEKIQKVMVALAEMIESQTQRLRETLVPFAEVMGERMTNLQQQMASFALGLSGLNFKVNFPDFQLPPLLLPKVAETFALDESEVAVLEISNAPYEDIVEIVQVNKPTSVWLPPVLIAANIDSLTIHTHTYPTPSLENAIIVALDGDVDEYERRKALSLYDALHQLETGLRKLIEKELERYAGEHWWRQRIPSDLRIQAETRKLEKEKGKGVSHHPITYLYIHHYKEIIINKANWRDVFKGIFYQQETTQSCFSWVSGPRDNIAHIRPITDDEYVEFFAGARWLIRHVNQVLKK